MNLFDAAKKHINQDQEPVCETKNPVSLKGNVEEHSNDLAEQRWAAVRSAYEAMEIAYENIPKGSKRKVFRVFFVKSVTLKEIDAATDEQIAILKSESATEEEKNLALKRLQEGMDYWLKVCLKKMHELGAKPSSVEMTHKTQQQQIMSSNCEEMTEGRNRR